MSKVRGEIHGFFLVETQKENLPHFLTHCNLDSFAAGWYNNTKDLLGRKKMFLEIIIVFGVSCFLVAVFSLIICISDKHTGEGAVGILDKNAKTRHYCLKKSRIFFVFVFLMNRKWKKGLISKDSFWGLLTVYSYLICASIVEIIFMCCGIILRLDMPLIFVGVWVLIPVLLLIVLPLTIGAKQKTAEGKGGLR